MVYHAYDDGGLVSSMGDFSIQAFEESGHENGTRFWFAHDFMRVLGYETWSSFQSVITKAMGSSAKVGLDPTEAFIPATFVDDAGKECKTYKLTRFACLLVTVNADSKKSEVAQAKAALAAIADQLIGEKIQDHDLGRLETREDLKLAEKLMSGAAQSAGLQGSDFGLFKDAGFRGMYNMGLRQLVKYKGLDPSKTLYDFMGLEELAGNLFRATQTTARIKSQGTRGRTPLMQTATAVGKEVRQMMMKNSGTTPEALPIADDVGKVRKRLKSADREMKKLDGPKKPKRLTKN
jgi:DNA-damage-inducible protein D